MVHWWTVFPSLVDVQLEDGIDFLHQLVPHFFDVLADVLKHWDGLEFLTVREGVARQFPRPGPSSLNWPACGSIPCLDLKLMVNSLLPHPTALVLLTLPTGVRAAAARFISTRSDCDIKGKATGNQAVCVPVSLAERLLNM